MKQDSIVFQRQQPLYIDYLENPQNAWITDGAIVKGKDLDDPFHTTVFVNKEMKTPFRIGVHKAVGGLHDAPNPGDMLCATLAACYESTMRMIASNLGIQLSFTKVKVTADVDVRGTLRMDKTVPVGFQEMNVCVQVQSNNTAQKMMETLCQATEKSCVIYQTLKQGISIQIHTDILQEVEV